MDTPNVLILMGVAGSGKTTIGELLADDLGWSFYDGDDFHPAENIAKMSQGAALTDNDREAWLTALRQLIERLLHEHQPAIIACSALKHAYRERLQGNDSAVQFIYLKGDYDLIQSRLRNRQGHFMKADLLKSQFEILEEPENTLTVDIAQEPGAIVRLIKARFGL